MVKNMLLLGAVLAVGLGVLEFAVRLLVPVRNVGPSFTIYDAEYGKRLKRSFTATRYSPEFTMSFSTNSLGFRGPETPNTPNGAILFLGDSFTEGYGVSDGAEFPAIIRETLRERGVAMSVVNAGIGDNGNGRWVKFLRDEAATHDPRLVVFQVHSNDFDDNLKENLFRLSESGELLELPVQPPGPARRVQTIIEAWPSLSYLHLVGLLRELPAAMAGGFSEPEQNRSANGANATQTSYRDRLALSLIEESLSICAHNRWPALGLLVGLEPTYNDLLKKLFVGFGFDVVVFPTRDEMPQLYYTVDGHWRPQGHELAAQMLLTKIGPYLEGGS